MIGLITGILMKFMRSGNKEFIMVAAEKVEGFEIYFDMDGVLADFLGGVEGDRGVVAAQETVDGLFGDKDMDIDDFRKGLRVLGDAKWKASMKPGFFSGLDILPGAGEMLEVAWVITGRLPHILTAPPDINRARVVREKRGWMREHFDGMYDRFIGDREKWKYAEGRSILIDDKIENINGWIEGGGIGILHGDPRDWMGTVKKLVKAVGV